MNLRWLASIFLCVACADLMGGQVDMLVTSIAGPMEQVKGGRLKILAVFSPEQKAFAQVVEDANIHAE